MAGTLYGLPLSQQINDRGDPLSGGLMYLYEANTSTPVTSYSDFALTIENTNPLVLDSAGRVPEFWLSDGSYRVRLTTSAGVEVFDKQSVTAIGASSGAGGGSGSVDSSTVFGTGDIMWKPITGTRTGWVRANGRTIGSASSGATERANADTQTLYEYLWNNYSDTLCAVSGGRGANAAADFAANKAIGTYTMRGKAAFGLDGMGNSTAGVIAGGTPDAVSFGGTETKTVAQANLPSYNLSLASLTGSVSTDISNGTNVARSAQTAKRATTTPDGDTIVSVSSSTIALNSGTVTFGGTLPSGGSGTALNTMPPYMLGTWYIKL